MRFSNGAVLVAISIPIFTSQLEKSRDSVTASNVRAAYAEAASAKLLEEGSGSNVTYNDDGTVTVSGIEVKGTDDNGAFGADSTFDLPFTLGDGVAAALDKGTTVSLTFTWDDNNVCTASTGGSSGTNP